MNPQRISNRISTHSCDDIRTAAGGVCPWGWQRVVLSLSVVETTGRQHVRFMLVINGDPGSGG